MENSTQTKIKLAPTQIWGMWGTIASAVPRGRSRAASRSAPSVGEQKTKIKERRKSRETAPEWKCGRASHPTAFVRGFLRCLITAWRRNDRFGPTALLLSRATSAACAKRVAHSQSRDHELASLRWPTVRPNSLLLRATSRWGEEAAMPGQPVALARVVWNVPRRFTLENHRAAAGSAAIIRQAQETSRFAGPTFRQIVAPRNTKNSPPCAEAVDDVTSLWKTEEN